ncbi:MAG: hypothetical protein GAK38_03789 [Xylophilus sp.]|nr:MAG: hypothetical protein GAK38_03789 [Xylophilus sp.]
MKPDLRRVAAAFVATALVVSLLAAVLAVGGRWLAG